jgi:acetyl esterase/lipase
MSEFTQATHVYRTVDGHDIHADVYRAPGDDIRPVVVWIHGGALIGGGREGLRASHRDRYLAAGYAVVSVDYRLAPETKLPGIIDDLTHAFGWVRGNATSLLRVDVERMAVVGHSAGGYLTLMAGLVADPRPKALVSYYGYGDLVGDWYAKPDPFYCQQDMVSEDDARAGVGRTPISNGAGEDGRGSFYLYCRQQGTWPYEVGGGDLASLHPYCPLQHVGADYPATLLLHGDNDTDVPYEQSVLMAEALESAGVAHELITIDGGGHGFEWDEEDEQVRDGSSRVMRFLAAQLGDG